MQNDVIKDHSILDPSINRQNKTALEQRGNQLDLGAPVTGAVAIGDGIAASFGDGLVRLFRPDQTITSINAHDGVILCLAADDDCVLTGGQDGKFLRISSDGTTVELANFGTKWVDCVAATQGLRACSSGKIAYVWSNDGTNAAKLEHLSTVGGLSFDTKGERLAVAHYGGVAIWEKRKGQWKRSRLIWQGSHGAVTFSPDGRYIVTAMQENALHGWRIRGKINLAMAGYPAKTKSFAWLGNTPYLITSGANEAICWPFDGQKGPMDRSPICVATHGKNITTCVQALPSKHSIFAGFQDGTVLLAELDESKGPSLLRRASGAEVTAIAITESESHILIGDAKGQVLWAQL